MKRSGFTIIELLVVMVILATLAALLVPMATRARHQANRSASLANLRNIGLGFHYYAQENDGKLPPQVESSTGLDWSGQLVAREYIDAASFRAPQDREVRRSVSPPPALGKLQERSYGNNSSKFTFLANGYQSPWPKTLTEPGAILSVIPPHILLAGENFASGGTGAYVGIPEGEGLDAFPRDLYPGGGASYLRADGSAFFAKPLEMNEFRADTDYGGDPRDPWKWK